MSSPALITPLVVNVLPHILATNVPSNVGRNPPFCSLALFLIFSLNKTFLANGVSTLFINGKPAVINGLRKFKNPPSWLVIFLVVPCNKITLFSKDLITLIIFFISLFVRVISFPKTLSELLL